MRKMEKRAILCILLAIVLFSGLSFYVFKYVKDGGDWVAYKANQNIYTDGYLSTGAIYDRNGELLLKNTGKAMYTYSSSYDIRRATLHAVGDNNGNIATGAKTAFADKLIGYNLISGTFSTNNKGRLLYLTIDADICAAANKALDGRKGTVGVYNYKTGEIVCMVSSPNFDPQDPPTSLSNEDAGIYMNKLISSTVVPGSIFKVITSTAAIETLDELDSWSYDCTGSKQFGSAPQDKVICPYAHGHVDFKEALAVSCNCAFADLSIKIGKENLKDYTEKAGLTSSYSINGIPTAKGSFEFPSSDVTLAWSGIGQYKDLVNPASMMIYMGAIANGGKAAEPRIIDSIKFSNGYPASLSIKGKTSELISETTAQELENMLHNNVLETYGEDNFPNLDLYAKSGTAEVGENKAPNSWFTGYIKNENKPYAFIVLVENGGWGSEVAGGVANTVLQKIVDKDN